MYNIVPAELKVLTDKKRGTPLNVSKYHSFLEEPP